MRIASARSGLPGALILLLAPWALPGTAGAQNRLPVHELELANGMKFLLVERPSMPTVEAGWVVTAGSADDPSDATGLGHFIEHMLFKGTRTIGSRNIEREIEVLDRLSAVEDELASSSRDRGRKAARSRSELERERAALLDEAASLTLLGAFSLEYSRVGATRQNANTAKDLTLYYVTLPAEALELWFWLESDRLREPVFREFAKEKDVVAEERRLRIASTPTGAADIALDAAFWQGTSYAQPTLGRPEDLTRLSRRRLAAFFTKHYQPAALTAVLVGNFDRRRVEALAEAYFGRLASGEPLPPDLPATLPERAERRSVQTCRCAPQVQVRYPTVAFGHPDQFPLQALAGLLNGRSGRLYRKLVLGEELAFAAFAQQTPLRRAGTFTVTLEAKGGALEEALVAAWDRELGLLLDAPPDADELERVQRRLATENLNQLKDPHLLMRRLLVYAGLGDWRQLAGWTERIAAVRPETITAVARRYLTPERRLIGSYERTGDPQ